MKQVRYELCRLCGGNGTRACLITTGVPPGVKCMVVYSARLPALSGAALHAVQVGGEVLQLPHILGPHARPLHGGKQGGQLSSQRCACCADCRWRSRLRRSGQSRQHGQGVLRCSRCWLRGP